jgi:hypothetical protein
MSKPYDYEELWDSFNSYERRAILMNIWHGRQRYNEQQIYTVWTNLPAEVRADLRDVDWEFSLGHRFSTPRP